MGSELDGGNFEMLELQLTGSFEMLEHRRAEERRASAEYSAGAAETVAEEKSDGGEADR